MHAPTTPSMQLASTNNRCENKGACMVCWEWEAKGKWIQHDEDVWDNPAHGPLEFVWLSQPELMLELRWGCWALLELGVNIVWCACNLLLFVVLSYVLYPVLAAGVSSCNHFWNIQNIRENKGSLSSEQKHVVCSHCSSSIFSCHMFVRASSMPWCFLKHICQTNIMVAGVIIEAERIDTQHMCTTTQSHPAVLLIHVRSMPVQPLSVLVLDKLSFQSIDLIEITPSLYNHFKYVSTSSHHKNWCLTWTIKERYGP